MSTGTIIKKVEMLKLVPDHLTTKKVRKSAVKNLPFVIRYVPDRYKAQEVCDKVILKNGGMLKFVPGYYRNQKCVVKLLIIMLMH